MHVLAVCNDPLTAPTSGIAVAFADVGIFTNQMMLADGTDNFAYAFHLTRYLATGPDGKRKRTICIFLENGEFRTDFDRAPLGSMTPPIPPLPIPPWAEIEKKLVTMAQDQVNDLEDRDWFEGKVAPLARDIGRVLALVVAAWLIIVVLLRAFRTRHAPAQTPLPRPPDGPETIIERKRQEILQTNDVYEPLREHLREQFAAWHCPPGAGHLPPIDVDGTKKERRRIEADLKRLWGVAFGDVPERVSFTRWKDYEAMLSNLADDADEGVWRFTPGGSA